MSGLFAGVGARIAAAIAVALLGVGVLVIVPMMGMFASLPSDALGGDASAGEQTCVQTVQAAGRDLSLGQDQLSNAAVIIATGRRLGVPARGQIIAVATAMQESTLRNLTYGDRDSVGLFQQRPSSGWGSVAELTDPPTAATKFYRALLQVPGWPSMPLTTAAQRVQRSAFPFAYAKWEAIATALVQRTPTIESASTRSSGSTAGCGQDVLAASLPSTTVGAMLRVALGQLGDPYVWGATGPDAFDCSGLIVYSWRQAGYRLSVRTAAQMAEISTPVAPGQEQPGDLYFGQFGTRVAGAGHVMIIVRPGVAVQAPATGRSVEMTEYDVSRHPGWRIGRLPSSALTPLTTPRAN